MNANKIKNFKGRLKMSKYKKNVKKTVKIRKIATKFVKF